MAGGDGTSRPGDGSEATARVGPFDDPDRYELIELRSRGGEGELWRGAVRVGGVPIDVAVKVVHQHHLPDLARWRQRWQQQAELLRSLDHPGLVKVREVFEGPLPHRPGAADGSQRTLYLVMNWVPGATLAEWVSRNPDRDLLEVVRIVARVAGAVDYLHSGTVTGHPILHRDIKPANVIVSGQSATLVDFGFVRLDQGDSVSIAGTPSYFAPELLRGAPYSEAADRYALGATTYFALTGEPPVTGDYGRARAALSAAAPLGGRVDLADHVLAMMNPEPSHRPVSTLEWAQGLAARAVSDTFTSPDPVPRTTGVLVDSPPPVAVGHRRRRWPLAVAAVIALLLGAAGAFAATRGDDGTGPEESTAAVGDDAPTSSETTEASTTTTTRPSTTTTAAIEMVEVAGLPLAEAEAALRGAGIDYEVEEQVGGGEIGTVVGQAPDPGEAVTGAARLVVAVAPETMPTLVGLTLREAQDRLEELGATATVAEVLDESKADGTVVGHTPAADQPFSPEVELQVARQPVNVFLAEVGAVEGGFAEDQAHVNGTNYVHSLVQYTDTRPLHAGYDLGRHFRRFRAVIGQRDDSESGATIRFEVRADGRPVYTKDLALGQQEAIDLDVTNVLRLQLVVTQLDDDDFADAYAVWADARIVGLPSEVPATPGD